MTADHATYKDEVGAYLLGALSDAEKASFEGHLVSCTECQLEVDRLRPAANLLPRSVEQVEPPPSLKRSLMEVVEREAQEGEGAAQPPARRERPGRSLGQRLGGLLGGSMRPVFVAGLLALGLVVGFGVAQLGGDPDDGRTVVASVKAGVLGDASGRLTLQGDGQDGGILEVSGMPRLRSGQVYQAWVERDGMVDPEPTFEVGMTGGGAVAVPDDLTDAQAVHLTREPRGGSQEPSEAPILTVKL